MVRARREPFGSEIFEINRSGHIYSDVINQGENLFAPTSDPQVQTICADAYAASLIDTSQGETPVSVAGVEVFPPQAFVDIGKSISPRVTIAPRDASNLKVTFKSDDEAIVTVDENGVITGVAEGEASIIVTTDDGNETAQMTVKVADPSLLNRVESIALSGCPSAVLDFDMIDRVDLQAMLTPMNATDSSVSLSSNNVDVATITPSGKVTLLKPGTAILSAVSHDGSFKDACTITSTSSAATVNNGFLHERPNYYAPVDEFKAGGVLKEIPDSEVDGSLRIGTILSVRFKNPTDAVTAVLVYIIDPDHIKLAIKLGQISGDEIEIDEVRLGFERATIQSKSSPASVTQIKLPILGMRLEWDGMSWKASTGDSVVTEACITDAQGLCASD